MGALLIPDVGFRPPLTSCKINLVQIVTTETLWRCIYLVQEIQGSRSADGGTMFRQTSSFTYDWRYSPPPPPPSCSQVPRLANLPPKLNRSANFKVRLWRTKVNEFCTPLHLSYISSVRPMGYHDANIACGLPTVMLPSICQARFRGQRSNGRCQLRHF